MQEYYKIYEKYSIFHKIDYPLLFIKTIIHMVKLYNCAGCLSISYCSTKCQREHWSSHKQFCKIHQVLSTDNAFVLFEQMATARNSEALFEDFQAFMKVHTPDGTLADAMEDYLDGFFKKDADPRITLRSLFRENGLEWTPYAWGLYLEWEQHSEGEGIEKMKMFVEDARPLFE